MDVGDLVSIRCTFGPLVFMCVVRDFRNITLVSGSPFEFRVVMGQPFELPV